MKKTTTMQGKSARPRENSFLFLNLRHSNLFHSVNSYCNVVCDRRKIMDYLITHESIWVN